MGKPLKITLINKSCVDDNRDLKNLLNSLMTNKLIVNKI